MESLPDSVVNASDIVKLIEEWEAAND